MTTADLIRLKPPSRFLFALELRAIPEFASFFAALPLLMAKAPCGDGHPVLVLPGLITGDLATAALRAFLSSKGYATYGWELGRNYGPRPGIEQGMIDRLTAIHAKHGRAVSIVGWSLGGIYARQLAKELPDLTRQVVTLGSPFNGDPRATNAWRLYERLSGLKVDDGDGHIGGRVADPPRAPSTAIYSRSDGICAWQTCMETERPNAENIEIVGSHCGLGFHPAALFAVADRLAQPEGAWTRFQRSGMRSAFYGDPERS